MGFVNARSDVRTQQVMSKMETTDSGVSIQGALDDTSIGTALLDAIQYTPCRQYLLHRKCEFAKHFKWGCVRKEKVFLALLI